eukprot:6186567-Pleurochrysis_carterae.AAC.2
MDAEWRTLSRRAAPARRPRSCRAQPTYRQTRSENIDLQQRVDQLPCGVAALRYTQVNEPMAELLALASAVGKDCVVSGWEQRSSRPPLLCSASDLKRAQSSCPRGAR